MVRAYSAVGVGPSPGPTHRVVLQPNSEFAVSGRGIEPEEIPAGDAVVHVGHGPRVPGRPQTVEAP